MPLNNFGACVPGLWRSAQPDEEGMRTLQDIGITTIIKLNTESPEEETWCNKAGIKLLQYPLPDVMQSFDEIRTVIEVLRIEMQRGIVLVHCQFGRDRTGLIIGAWRIVYQGWDVTQADAERKLYGVEGAVKIMDLPMEFLLQAFWENRNGN